MIATLPSTKLTPSDLPCDLGKGLVLRFATPGDTEALAQFNGRVHGDDHFDEFVAAYTRDLMSEAHPSVGPANITLVEDAAAGNKIVSSMCLIPQRWAYAGIPFGVGRPEVVGTDPDHRRRGLVRAQFDVLHAKSAAMGHRVQGITGIPWYYRQFEYEYALELDGGRIACFADVPTLGEAETESHRLRPLGEADLAWAMPLYDREASRSLVACLRSEQEWRFILHGAWPGSWNPNRYRVIEASDGQAVGYLATSADMDGKLFRVFELAVIEGQALRAAMPSVLRGLKSLGEAEAAGRKKEVSAIYFNLGTEHPLYPAIPELLAKTRKPYGWYIRVADLPGFIRHIAPVLEARLARSPMTGHTGELKVNEYTGGFRIAFEKGRIASVEPWQAPKQFDEDAAFPPRAFLPLLFGYRALADLRTAFPDCWANADATVLLNSLFPCQASQVIPIN